MNQDSQMVLTASTGGLVAAWTFQHKGDFLELVGVSTGDTLTVQPAELFQDHHYTPGLTQGLAIGNYCCH